MTLQEYTTEELKAELKRRNDLIKSERSKIKRCKQCKHWGEVYYWGKPKNEEQIKLLKSIGGSKPCGFFKTKNDKYYRCHSPYQVACEHFESIVEE